MSEAVAAEAGTDGVVLILRPGGAMQGIVLDSQTQRPSAAAVTISGQNDPKLGVHLAVSKDDGLFRGQGLEPGTYALCAHTSDGRYGILRDVEVQVGGEAADLVIALAAGSRLRLRYEGEEEYASVAVLQDDAVIAFDGVQKGHTVEWTVAPGSLTVRFHTRSAPTARERTLELAVGETQEVVLGED